MKNNSHDTIVVNLKKKIVLQQKIIKSGFTKFRLRSAILVMNKVCSIILTTI